MPELARQGASWSPPCASGLCQRPCDLDFSSGPRLPFRIATARVTGLGTGQAAAKRAGSSRWPSRAGSSLSPRAASGSVVPRRPRGCGHRPAPMRIPPHGPGSRPAAVPAESAGLQSTPRTPRLRPASPPARPEATAGVRVPAERNRGNPPPPTHSGRLELSANPLTPGSKSVELICTLNTQKGLLKEGNNSPSEYFKTRLSALDLLAHPHLLATNRFPFSCHWR